MITSLRTLAAGQGCWIGTKVPAMDRLSGVRAAAIPAPDAPRSALRAPAAGAPAGTRDSAPEEIKTIYADFAGYATTPAESHAIALRLAGKRSRRLFRPTVLRAGTVVAVAALAGPVSAVPAAAATVPNPLVVVYMENQSLSTVIGTGQSAVMPYLNSLWGSASTEQFTDYYAVAHPSFPNYAAMASGETQMEGDAVTPGQFSGQTVWDQLQAAGVSWGVYQEAVPTACYAGTYHNDTTVSDGPYKIGHNPAVPFAGVYDNSSECQKVQPFTGLNPMGLPAVSFVTPNLCDDMHGLPATNSYATTYAPCTQSTNAIRTRGDSWLAKYVPQWTAAGADVLITFDEGSGTAGCCGAPGGGQIYGVLTGPGVTGGANATPMNQYSILAGIEDAYGLPLLGNAATASPVILPGSTTAANPVITITTPASNATVSGTLTVSGTAADAAGISQVQVSVDGGTPVTATGTTA